MRKGNEINVHRRDHSGVILSPFLWLKSCLDNFVTNNGFFGFTKEGIIVLLPIKILWTVNFSHPGTCISKLTVLPDPFQPCPIQTHSDRSQYSRSLTVLLWNLSRISLTRYFYLTNETIKVMLNKTWIIRKTTLVPSTNIKDWCKISDNRQWDIS